MVTMRHAVVVGLLLGTAVRVSAAVAPVPAALLRWSGWLVYWDVEDGLRALQTLGPGVGEVAVFAYHFDADGRLIPAAPELTQTMERLRAAAGPDRALFATVVNDREGPGGATLKDPAIVHQRLATPEAITAHVQEILTLAAPFDGVEIDYENVRPADRAAFTAFVEALAATLHERGQRLAVVVQPKVKEEFKDGAGAMDWPALAAAADEIKIMAYHYHWATGAPGPLAPPEWVAEIAAYAVETIPPEKRCIALTLQGLDWPAAKPARAIEYHEAMALAAAHHARIKRDPATATPYFRYRGPDGLHEVWFEDAASLREKVTALRQAGIRQIALWRLGTGDPEFLKTTAAGARSASGT